MSIKRNIIYGVILLIAFCFSCTKETTVPVELNFNVEVVNQDYSVPSTISVTNNTRGADTFEWTFEGGVPAFSQQQNPGDISYRQAGTYAITLNAANKYGTSKDSTIYISLDDSVSVDFDLEVIESAFPPVEVKIHNKCSGTSSYKWDFAGATLFSGSAEQPQSIVYKQPGEYMVTLRASNGRETYTVTKQITVLDDIIADFDWEVNFFDTDYQVPVTIRLNNKSVSATAYQWHFTGANIPKSSEASPEITFDSAGTYTMRLVADNGKKQVEQIKTIETYEDTNLRILKDIKLGINSAHASLGCFYSTSLRKNIKKGEINDTNAPLIDIVYFGLNSNFNYNKFISPAQASQTTFKQIPDASHTVFINSQENVPRLNVTENDFETMIDDTLLRTLIIEETDAGKKEFTGEQVPRIVLFKTEDGRKGIIHIKAFVDNEIDSYVLCDIKAQKKALNN